jgi:hypothetical protein
MFGFSLDLADGTAVVGRLLPGGDEVTRFQRTALGWVSRRHRVNDAPAQNGRAESARFTNGWFLDRWVDDSVVVWDAGVLRRVDAAGVVTRLGDAPNRNQVTAFAVAGDGTVWWAEQTNPYPSDPHSWELLRMLPGDGAAVVASGPGYLNAIEPDETGGVYLATGCRVVRFTSSGPLEAVAGSTICGFSDGPSGTAGFSAPSSLALAPGGVLFVGDDVLIRRVSLATGTVETVAGHRPGGTPVDGTGTNATFRWVAAIALDAEGGLWITDAQTLRRMDGTLKVTTVAGTPRDYHVRELVDGIGSMAVLDSGGALTVALGGIPVFANRGTVRVAHEAGEVRTIAGVPDITYHDEFLAYGVAIHAARILAGVPRATSYLGTSSRAGIGWVFQDHSSPWSDATPSMPVFRMDAQPYARYGAGVTFTSAGDVVLGPANGCLWVGFDACGDDSFGTSWHDTVYPIRLLREAADGLWRERAVLPTTGAIPRSGFGSVLGSSGRWLVAGAPEWDYRPQEGPPYGDIVGPGRVFVYDLDTLDSDGDGMSDTWEERFGLNPTDADDAALDADGDGVTNRDEFSQYTHPRNDPALTRHFAEGATSDFFETRFAVANPGDEPATVAFRFTSALATSGTTLTIPPRASQKLALPLDAWLGRADFSTSIESDRLVGADRLMTWDRAGRFGSHGERATVAPSPTWYLAEGATHSGFDLFYLIQNPGDTATDVRVTYLRPSGPPLVQTYRVAARSRFTVWVNVELFSGHPVIPPPLSSTDVSAVVETLDGTPIIVERAMYLSKVNGRPFEAGHASAGVTEPSTRWFFAEGATGDFFDLFLLVANPHDTPVVLRGTYSLPDGRTFTKHHTVAPTSRFNIWVDREPFDGHAGFPLADVAVSATLEVISGGPVIAERAMWWPGPTYATWTEAHNSAGATTTATRWVAATGEVCDTPRTDTYYLIANPGSQPAEVRVTLLFDDGTPALARTFPVTAHSRFNVDVRTHFPDAVGKGFGAVIESLGASPAPIVVEWAIYNDALGRSWAAGASALATAVP